MSFINNLIDKSIDRMLGGERQLKSPVFIKDFTKENQQLKDLTKLYEKLADGPKKEWVERDINYLKVGIKGEENVYYELKNTFMPIICLHDIRLDYGGYIAQFDFIVISNKFICVLETKKLSGNIVINQDGDFIRVIKNKYGKEIKREGIYSPISQNQRHLDILKDILLKEKLIKYLPLKSLVVLANPKTIIDKKYCPKSITNSIYKYDQVVNCLRKFQDDKTNEMNAFEKSMHKIAEFLIANNKPLEIDYSSKYSLTNDDFIKESVPLVRETNTNYTPTKGKDPEQLTQLLKEFRLNKSREEKVKPYFIFNNAQMEDLIAKHPTTEAELLKVSGFGVKKVEKYGKEILDIFRV